jgi:SAM-dependent methyltransferase
MPTQSNNLAAPFATSNSRFSQAHTPALSQTHCPVCAEAACHFVSTKDRDGKPLKTVACTRCGLYRVDPLPSTAELAQFHEQEYRNSYKGVRQPKRKHIYRSAMLAVKRLKRLAPHLGQRASVLDIGCASGEWLYILGTQGNSALGIEVDGGYAAFGRGEYGVDIRNGSVHTFGGPDHAVDCITMFHVLEHLPDPLSALRRIHAWLKPGGHFVVEVPNVASLCQHPAKRFHYAHVVGYTPASLAYAVRESGWRIVELTLDQYDRNILAVLQKPSESNQESTSEPIQPSFQPTPVVPSSPSATIQYYLRPSTYVRYFARMKQFGVEYGVARKSLTPRKILDSSLRHL